MNGKYNLILDDKKLGEVEIVRDNQLLFEAYRGLGHAELVAKMNQDGECQAILEKANVETTIWIIANLSMGSFVYIEGETKKRYEIKKPYNLIIDGKKLGEVKIIKDNEFVVESYQCDVELYKAWCMPKDCKIVLKDNNKEKQIRIISRDVLRNYIFVEIE